ncbi:MAG: recombination and strand exchange inhibitor protein [Deltaproteobacteria bacterium]|nr:recombination and strand exchange inhibitor protein [Deltaproteobacteria bacterium]
MRPRDLAALEFDHVRNRLADFACASAGKEACRALVPTGERVQAEQALEAAWQCFRLLEQEGTIPLAEFPDVRASLRTAARDGAVLDGKSLVEIRQVLASAQETRAFFRRHTRSFPALASLPDLLAPLPELHQTLMRALDDNGDVSDDASDELAEVRRTIRHLRARLTRRLEDLLTQPTMAELLGDRYVTLRNNRFVIPVKTAMARQFDGVVQDRSASGETVFIEPLFAVELNNHLLMASKEEEWLAHRILGDLTAVVRAEHDTLAATFAVLVETDVLLARARFAQHYRCTQPRFAQELLLRSARHPGLLCAGRDVIPVDLVLPAGKRVLVITGPNTGGKTVALKTLGLVALMAQSGILIPVAEGGCLPCFQAVYADIGDEQNVERNLSTFSAHVANLTAIIEQCRPPSLVLLDEPGVGTDPDEGAALGIGMVQVLENAGAHVALSTHYAPLKVFALSRDTCVTAAVDFDVEAMAPRYRLVYHSIGESLALPIAQRLGLPVSVLDAAQAARSQQAQTLAAATARLEEARRRYEERLAEVEARARGAAQAEEDATRLLEELRAQRRQRWAEELRAAREFVHTLRDEGRELLAAVERGRVDRRTFTRWVHEREAAIAGHASEHVEPPVVTAPPQIGDQVEVVETGIRGQLLSIEGDRARIQRGSLRFEVPTEQLRRMGPQPAAAVEVRLAAAPDETPQEISLLGLRAKEAVAQLDRFLDRATQAQHRSVRIIHGLGSGALKRAVEEYLSTSPYCASFRSAEPRAGGIGVTIATLASE